MTNGNYPSAAKRLQTFFTLLLAIALASSLITSCQSSPMGGSGQGLIPDTEEAKKIFQVLHKNVYDTFNEKNAELAYDRLARSGDDAFLEEVYQEIYDYFQGVQAGGPSLEVVDVQLRNFEKIKKLKKTPTRLPSTHGNVYFNVQVTWDVLSIVTHQKHWHFRSNNFKAVYTLGLKKGEWKIIQDDILWQRRIPLDLSSFKS